MAQREVVVGSRIGLHARRRPVVKAATEQAVKITVRKGDGPPSTPGASCGSSHSARRIGDTVTLEADGDGAPKRSRRLRAWSPRTTTIPRETAEMTSSRRRQRPESPAPLQGIGVCPAGVAGLSR